MESDNLKPVPVGTMLLVLPVSVRIINNELFFEEQACNGLRLWAENFPYLIVAAPVIPEYLAIKDKTISWKPVSSIIHRDQIRFVNLPWSYSPLQFVKNYSKTKLLLKSLIMESTYLQFMVGGFFGDWGSVASFEAYKLSRSYSTHMDWITHKVMIQSLSDNASTLKYLKEKLSSFLAHYWNNFVISKSSLALCHGKNVYDYYKDINTNSFLIHDVHYSRAESANSDDTDEKKKRILSNDKLIICYTGRMAAMKAPIQWLKAISHAVNKGAKLEATWYGDGPLYSEFLKELDSLNLKEVVKIPGFITDRKIISKVLGDADLFVMTHISDESPRCLIESLIRATPILGYDSAYARDLIKINCAGKLCPLGDWESLGELLYTYYEDRQSIIPMIDCAQLQGLKFADDMVFKERSDLIKKFCRPISK